MYSRDGRVAIAGLRLTVLALDPFAKLRRRGVAVIGRVARCAADRIVGRKSRIKEQLSTKFDLRKRQRVFLEALFLTGSRFGASRALQLGLVHQVVEPDQLDEATAQTVGELLQCSPEAQARIKALLPRVANLTLQEASAHTIAEIASARASEQAKLGMAAFLAKKKPPWVAE